MTTLSLILDDADGAQGRHIAGYALDLGGALVRVAPDGCDVEASLAAEKDGNHERVLAGVPGLAQIRARRLERKSLASAWALGLGPKPEGLVHSPSLLAPLAKHDRVNDSTQVVVTIHDVRAWAAPDALPAGEAAWQRRMAKRARRFADAVVVPTHAVAEELGAHVDFGDRIRVIPEAVSERFAPAPQDEGLPLPTDFVLTTSTLHPGHGLTDLIAAMRALPDDASLVVIGSIDRGELAAAASAAGVDPDRVIAVPDADQSALHRLHSRARVFALPSRLAGFGLPMLHAFRTDTPVVHAGTPALREVAGGAGVEVDPGSGLGTELAEALLAVWDEGALRERHILLGRDRDLAFGWESSAAAVWQLHAEI